MITYDKLKQKPRAFRSLTGMSITEFDELYQKLTPVWARSEHERLVVLIANEPSGVAIPTA